jgi:hypothetical protein
MINGKIENFIGIYDNAVSVEDCTAMIRYFEDLRQYNLVVDQDLYTSKATYRKDESAFMLHPDVITLPKGSPILAPFINSFWHCYEDYCKEFDILKSAAKHGFYMLRIQRTNQGGGFHNWHFENTGCETANRVVTFMMYLNDIEEGGETEFLYLHKRLKPEAGRLLIWPSTYSHTHRGNPPLSGTKYIITGWLTYFE